MLAAQRGHTEIVKAKVNLQNEASYRLFINVCSSSIVLFH